MSRKQFIVVFCGGFINYIYSDLRLDDRVIVLEKTTKQFNNFFLKALRHIHINSGLNEKIDLPFKGIWGKSLDEIKWDNETQYYVIFVDPYPLPPSYLIGLREKNNIKYILLATFVWGNNTWYSKMQRNYEKELKYDYIFSFDPSDAEKYNFIYNPVSYSVISPNGSNTTEYDLYLAANAKTRGRLPVFNEIYEHIRGKGVSTHYRLTGVKNDNQVFKGEIIYNKPIKYPEIIEGVKKSNCILEVLARGQSGCTLRYYESVCYNKKLLTNNKNVVNLPFYNPDYIHIFEKPEDIDCDWVKERIPVDYHYDGRFSPTHLIDRIIELEEEKEGKTGGSEQAS